VNDNNTADRPTTTAGNTAADRSAQANGINSADRTTPTGDENNLLAQNQPPAGRAVPLNDPNGVNPDSELPRTASPVFLVFFTGLIALVCALMLRRLRA
jgi:hypothetical protein